MSRLEAIGFQVGELAKEPAPALGLAWRGRALSDPESPRSRLLAGQKRHFVVSPDWAMAADGFPESEHSPDLPPLGARRLPSSRSPIDSPSLYRPLSQAPTPRQLARFRHSGRLARAFVQSGLCEVALRDAQLSRRRPHITLQIPI
jgi:hypothetical protein